MRFYIKRRECGSIYDDQVISLPLFDLCPKSISLSKVETEYVLKQTLTCRPWEIDLTEEQMRVINNVWDACSKIGLSTMEVDLYHSSLIIN